MELNSPEDREERTASAPLSKSEAVRRALDAGHEEAKEGVAYILKEFGIVMVPSLFLAAKATERKKGWTKSGKPGRKTKAEPKRAGEVVSGLGLESLDLD